MLGIFGNSVGWVLHPYGVWRRAGKAFAAFIFLIALAVLPARADPPAVAALGDSLTQGFGLFPEDGLVPRLQAWLDANGHPARLVNAGVSGDTTAGGLARLDWTLTDDVAGLIVELGGNDVLRGLDPAQARANLDAILARADQRGLPVLLVGVVVPSNYGADYKEEFESIYADLAARHGTLLYPDFFAALRETGDLRTVMQRYMQADGIHPSADGVRLIVADLGPYVAALLDRIAAR